MAKKNNPQQKGSPIHRRTFPGVRLDAVLEHELRQAAAALGYPMEWQEEDAGLVVSRCWFEGTDYRKIFGESTPQDRLLFSRDLFTQIFERLEGLRHSALHPGNVLHVGSSPVLLDPIANAARLGGTEGTLSPIYAVWLWAPRVPEDWEVSDWDRVNLLRMAMLLARGPASWESAPATTEAVKLCREWAEGFRRALPAGADAAAILSRVLELLRRLEREPEKDSFATVVQLLSGIFERQGEDRMLRPADEDKVRTLARETASDPSDELLAVELLRRGVQRQSELKHQAEAFLRAGVYPGTKFVKRSARRNAERLYCAYGVAEGDAGVEVQSLLAELGLLDEMEAQKTWSKLVDEYVEKHCRRGYNRRHFGEMMALVDIYELPRGVAENRLLRYLEREKKLRARRGFLGIG